MRIVFMLLLAMGGFPAPVSAAGPHVAATTPASGDGGVEPGLTEIRVTFDQPMDPSSYSFVALGSGFPHVTGQPYWVDDFTVALPVHLEPDQAYWLLLNSSNAQGFRNRSGAPAVPHLLGFWTAGGADGEDPDDVQSTRNRRSYAQVVEIMTVYYSYKDRLGIDWARRLAAAEERLLASPNDFLFGLRLIDTLAPARDPHLSVGINDVRLPTTWAVPPPNYNLQAVLTRLTNVRRWSTAVVSGETESIGYVLVGGWVPEAAAAAEAIAALRHKEALIVDVRPNSGGDERVAQLVAGCFTDQAIPYAKSLTMDPETREFARSHTRTFQPNPDCGPYGGQVIVLTGPQVMSSNESFLMMMRQAGATLFGAPSFGSSGNPKPYELDNGLVLYVPQWQDMDLDGRLVEGNGITPDILLDLAPDRFVADDPVFGAAVELVGH